MCFLFHDYEKIIDELIYTEHESILFRKEWTEQNIVKVYKCNKCGYTYGKIYDEFGHEKLSEVMLRQILNMFKE